MRLVLLLAAATFAVSAGHDLVWDDWSMAARPWFSAPVTRPLTEATLWANRQISAHPAGFHIVNVALHLLAVWLVFDVLRRMIAERAALIAAAIFAVHPLQAEAVNYIWARSNLLMAVFCLLTLRDWLTGRPWRAVLWFSAALLAKQECVALPLVLLMLPARDRPLKPVAAMLAEAGLVGGYVVWAANTTLGSQAGAQSRYFPLDYLSREGTVILRYLQSFLLPFNLTPDPALPHLGWIAWLTLFAAAAISWRFGPWLVIALILVLPSSSVFPADDLAADRRMYLPMFALAAAAGLLLQRFRLRWLAILAAILTVVSIRQSLIWKNDGTLWSHVLRQNPLSVKARLNLARGGLKPDIIPLLERAKEIAPDDPAVASALGRAYMTWGGPARALPEFGRALALAPNSPEAINNRGMALLALGQTGAARADFERALRIDPCLFEARLNLKRATGQAPAAPGCRYLDWQTQALQGTR